MKKVSDNSFKKASFLYKKNTMTCLLITLLYLASLVLVMTFPVFGFGVAFFISGFLCLGLKTCMLNISMGKKVKVEEIFYDYKYILSAFILKFCQMVLILLWSLLLIVPGIIVALNYSQSFYIYSQNKKMDTTEILNESKRMMFGHRSQLFIICATEILILFGMAIILFGITGLMLYLNLLPTWVMVSIPLAIIAFIYIIFIAPYFHILKSNFYLQILSDYNNENKPLPDKKNTKKQPLKKPVAKQVKEL